MSGLDVLSDVFRLASTVLAAGPGEPPEARLALAWVARNRSKAGLAACCAAALPGDGTLTGACRPASAGDQLRALAIACQVLTGDLPDPTGGAVLLHRHDEQPEWAAGRRPSALLGSHFFYRLD